MRVHKIGRWEGMWRYRFFCRGPRGVFAEPRFVDEAVERVEKGGYVALFYYRRELCLSCILISCRGLMR